MPNLKQKLLFKVTVIGFIITAVCITACSDGGNKSNESKPTTLADTLIGNWKLVGIFGGFAGTYGKTNHFEEIIIKQDVDSFFSYKWWYEWENEVYTKEQGFFNVVFEYYNDIEYRFISTDQYDFKRLFYFREENDLLYMELQGGDFYYIFTKTSMK